MIKRTTRALALITAVGAIGAPAASAMLPPPDPVAHPGAASQPVIVKSVHDGGFDFGDAAIGAGAAFALVLAGTGTRLALHRVRQPQMSPASR
jgi:hypothetical protein